MHTTALPRGLRNNNPLNLRISQSAWLGKVKNNTDGAFEQFVSLPYGYRAAFLNMRTLVRRLSASGSPCKVIDLISVWAPSSDGNHPVAYATAVSRYSPTIWPNSDVNIKDREFMCQLAVAMAHVENGVPVSLAPVYSGYDMAFPLYGK